MCGIAGFVSTSDVANGAALLHRMADAIRHRGPDDDGYFVEPRIGLAARRLSIVDVAGGHQPIANEDGSVRVVFNGEIYNYVELRAELEARGHRFTTRGDTETLVHLYEEHGTSMLPKLRGMFAFALWDSRKETLFLARDRLGKKPLNYVSTDAAVYFCSELAPLLDEKFVPAEIDPDALAAYLMFGFISAPRTMVRQIRKLPAAHYLTWRGGEVNVQRYWSVPTKPSYHGTYGDARDEVRAKLDESIRLRLRSDVPLGLLLSGGLDSNAVLARLVRGVRQEVQTFTIGFSEKDYDESAIARASARHFGVEHQVLKGDTDLLKLVPDAVRHLGEPSADKSILPTMLVCELTRQHVKVALSGDGGDEAFAGYGKHRLTTLQQRISGSVPRELKERWTFDAMIGTGWLGKRATRKLRPQIVPEMPSLFSGEFFSGPIFGDIATDELRTQTNDSLRAHVADFWRGELEPLERIFHWDNTDPLPYSLLVKLDIASMSRSLEVRSPFLDHELVELCATLPPDWKGNSHEGKLILRDIVVNDLPPEVVHARKRGFSLPLAQWWRGAARNQIREGVLPLHESLRPFLSEIVVTRLLEEHQSGRANHAQRLWNLWVLNEWARMFLSR